MFYRISEGKRVMLHFVQVGPTIKDHKTYTNYTSETDELMLRKIKGINNQF